MSMITTFLGFIAWAPFPKTPQKDRLHFGFIVYHSASRNLIARVIWVRISLLSMDP